MWTRDAALAVDHFPGALKSETLLGQAWVREHGAPYVGFDFNVALGDGRDPGDRVPAPLRAAAIEASKPRVDLIAYADTYVDLLETKGRADMAAMGQLMTYEVLWNWQHPDLPVRLVGVICAVMNPTLLSVFNQAHVPVFIYPELVDAIRRT